MLNSKIGSGIEKGHVTNRLLCRSPFIPESLPDLLHPQAARGTRSSMTGLLGCLYDSS